MKKKLIALLLVTCLVMAALLSACTPATTSSSGAQGGSQGTGKVIDIKIAHGATETTAHAQGWVKFKELLEAKAPGQFNIEIYPNQQLGGDRELTESCTQGNVTMGSPSTAPVASFVPEINVFESPFVFSDRESVYKLLDGEMGRKMLDTLESANLHGLGYFENGFRNLTANKEVRTPADLAGLKVRTMENKIHMAAWTELGANPSPLAFGELFTALQQKTFDAQENPYELIWANKFYEVQKYIMATQHVYTPYVLFCNLDWWNSLSKEQQTAIDECIQEATKYQREKVLEVNEQAIAAFKDYGNVMVDLTADERAQFVAKVQPVYKQIIEAAGPVANEFYEAVGIKVN